MLITAIALAILYFALMELMLIDSSRALVEAQRFRSRIIAATLAESAAELSAASMVSRNAGDDINATDEQGTMKATCKVNGTAFEIDAEGTTKGVMPTKSTVSVQGRILGPQVKVDYTYHSQ
ncbi:MAG TPA: hypothetical protein VNN08_12105 [Thermoanaerobaculia bacterium]|nr:hypothetical protein [Thermoanaerobaculia bacterium]